MQQRRVVGVLQVLEHQLPIAWNKLAGVAQYLQLPPVEDPVHEPVDGLAEILFVGLHVRVHAGEDRPVVVVHLQDIEAVLLALEVGGHAALLTNAPAQRHPDQVALQIVGPLVIGADELGRVAEIAFAELHPAMGAAVHEGVDLAFRVARDHDRTVAEPGALVIAGIGNLRRQRHVVPRLAAEDALHLPLIDCRVGIKPIGDMMNPGLGPSPLGYVVGRRYGHADTSARWMPFTIPVPLVSGHSSPI